MIKDPILSIHASEKKKIQNVSLQYVKWINLMEFGCYHQGTGHVVVLWLSKSLKY